MDMFDLNFLQSIIRSSTPILLAGLAAVISYQAGVLNIGVEGIMTGSAFMAVYVSYTTSSWILGMLAAVITGVVVAIILGVAHIKYKADIFAVGMAINMLMLAVTKFGLQKLLNTTGSFYSEKIVQIPRINFSGNNSTVSFGNFSLMDIVGLMLTVFFAWLVYKTVWGLRLRSVGLFPAAAQAAGLNIERTKIFAIGLSGVLGGLAGAHLSIGYSAMFVENMTNGRGFMGVAAMLFGRGNPIYTYFGCLIFGAADSLGAQLQSKGVPSQFMQMLPYVVTILVMSIGGIRNLISQWKKRRDQKKLFMSYKGGES